MEDTTITVDSGPAWIAAWQDEYCQCHYRIHQDGEVEVYDDVAGGYTRCHSLTAEQLEIIRAAVDLVTAQTITDDQIRILRREAEDHGDLDQAAICMRALGDDDNDIGVSLTQGEARAECARVISDAEAMQD